MKKNSIKSFKNKKLYLLLSLAFLLICIVLFGVFFAPHNPLEVDYDNILLFFSKNHILGTDHLGRDILSRLLYGARPSVLSSIVVVVICSFLGTAIGFVSGYFGGYVDKILSNITDIMLSIPSIIFTIAIVTFLGVGMKNVILAMISVSWIPYMRMSRLKTIALKNSDMVFMAKLGGASSLRIGFKYILSEILPLNLVLMTQDFGEKLLTLSSLSLLGLGMQPPNPEWGYMLSEGKNFMIQAPWLLIYPGLIIFIYVVVFNLLGDRLNDLLNPEIIK